MPKLRVLARLDDEDGRAGQQVHHAVGAPDPVRDDDVPAQDDDDDDDDDDGGVLVCIRRTERTETKVNGWKT